MSREMGVHRVHRSNKCTECKRRRVKVSPRESQATAVAVLTRPAVRQCDEQRPFCTRCRLGNRQCPGYEEKYIFLPQEPRPSDEVNTSPDTASTLSDSNGDPTSPAADACDCPGYAMPESVLEQLQQTLVTSRRHPQFRPLNSSAVMQEQLLAVYIASVCPDRAFSQMLPRELCLFREWLRYVPQYLGTRPLLDDAMRCLTLVHLARLNNDDAAIRDTGYIYCRAIHELHQAINTDEGLSSLTLCATLFLSKYEACDSSPISYENAATNLSSSSWLVPGNLLGFTMLAALRS